MAQFDEKVIKDNLLAVQRRKSRYAIFKVVENKSIVLEHLSERKGTNFKSFIKALPGIEPRYTIVDLEYKSADGRQTSKVFCIFWCPLNANQTDRIVYSEALHNFRLFLTGVINKDCKTIKDVEAILSEEFVEGVGYTVPQQKKHDSDEEEEHDFD